MEMFLSVKSVTSERALSGDGDVDSKNATKRFEIRKRPITDTNGRSFLTKLDALISWASYRIRSGSWQGQRCCCESILRSPDRISLCRPTIHEGRTSRRS